MRVGVRVRARVRVGVRVRARGRARGGRVGVVSTRSRATVSSAEVSATNSIRSLPPRPCWGWAWAWEWAWAWAWAWVRRSCTRMIGWRCRADTYAPGG